MLESWSFCGARSNLANSSLYGQENTTQKGLLRSDFASNIAARTPIGAIRAGQNAANKKERQSSLPGRGRDAARWTVQMLSSKLRNPDHGKHIVGAFPNAFQAWTRNLPVTVQMVGPGDFEQHQGFLVGNLRKDNLILGGFQNVAFGLGQQLIVRMVVDKKALGFQTTITGVLDMPERLFIGTFPGEMETLNLRSSERINVFFPSTVRATVGDSEDPRVHMISSRVLNIGSGGCRFSSQQPLEPETEISISFSLPGERHVLTLVGRVLRKEQRQSVYSHSTAFPNRADNLLGRSEIESWVCQNVAFCAE